MASSTRNNAPVSPLRYPGAKRWMSSYISRSITHNNLYPKLYVEPFVGGASVTLALLKNNLVAKVGLVDRDPIVAAFWESVFFDTEWLINRVANTDITLNKWIKVKKQKARTTRQKAFKCLYLNRTSFSGILTSSAGPIGGKSQASKYKIDCRFNKTNIIKRIEKISAYRDRIAFVWNLHWHTAIGKINQMQNNGSLPKSTLFYLDPPFYDKANSLYNFHFKHNDHLKLRNFLLTFKQNWILSYDSHPEIISMYKGGGYKACDVNLIYTASNNGNRGLGKEVIVSNLKNMVSELKLGANKHASHPETLSNKHKSNSLSCNTQRRSTA